MLAGDGEALNKLPRHVTAWSPATRIQPWNSSTYTTLRDCEHLRRLLRSLPSADADDALWNSPWAEYVDSIYGRGAARRVDARRLVLLRGVALRNSEHSVVDRRPWSCNGYNASNVRAQGVRAIVVWPTSGSHSPTAYASDNQWVEVYRSRYDDFAGGEGVGYGCWFHRAPGSGVWLNTGRTIGMSRTAAAARFGRESVRRADGSLDPRLSTSSPCLLRRGKSCACFWCVSRVPAQAPALLRPAQAYFSKHLGRTEEAPHSPIRLLGTANLESAASRIHPWNASASCAAYPRQSGTEERFSLPCLDGLWALGAFHAGYDTVQLVASPGFAPLNEAEILVSREVCLSGRHEALGACPPAELEMRAGLPGRRHRCACDDQRSRNLFPTAAASGWLPMVCATARKQPEAVWQSLPSA